MLKETTHKKKSSHQENPKNQGSDNKQGWEIKRLEDVVEFQRGLTYSKKDEVDFSDNIVLRSNNVDLFSNQLDFSELKYINPSIEIPENKKVKKGSLLICTANGSKSHLGKVALIDDDYNYAFGGFMGLINPKQKLDSKFLFYLMTSDNYKKFINELSDGANINNLKFGDLGQFEIPLPPLPEQQRIVSILDECFAAIDKAKANAEQNLKNAKELFDCVLESILYDKKWHVELLGNVCEKVEYGTSSKAKSQGELPVLRMGNIQNGRFVWDSLVYSDNEEDNKQYLLKHNDVLFNRTNSPELVGKTAIYKSEQPAIFAGYLIRIHRKENLLDADYLNYYLNSKIAFEYGRTVVISSVNQANINGTKLKTYPIPLPTLKEQQTIVRQLDALRAETQKLEAVYQKKITDLEELKKSILQKAFAGELRSPEGAEYTNDGYSPSNKKTSPERA